jgi:hypothetical protein
MKHDMLRDSLAIAVPLRMQELQDWSWEERANQARWAAQQFQHADAMMFDPLKKTGQFAHLVDILAVLALNHEGGLKFSEMTFAP